MRAIGPACASRPKGLGGHCGTRAKVGLIPVIPQNAPGMRIEPPPSVPSASGAMPFATAAALPPLEPPAVRAGSHGLRVTGTCGPSVTPFHPSCGVVVLPTSTAPWRRSAATAGASTSQLAPSATAGKPRRVGHPAVRKTSLTATGTPSSSPAGVPRRQRASLSPAEASAASGSVRQKAASSPSWSRIAARQASVASTGERSPLR